MFLFAKLVMENLGNQTSQNDLRKELEPTTFPVDLGQAYDLSLVFLTEEFKLTGESKL